MRVNRQGISRCARDILNLLEEIKVGSIDSFVSCEKIIKAVPYIASVELKKDGRNGRKFVLYKLNSSRIYTPLKATIGREINLALRCCEEVEGYVIRANDDMYGNCTQSKTLPENKWEDFIGELEDLTRKISPLLAKVS